ncbi:unnamed protein product [Ilex paraguariensis]|uniref:BZIP domain-containing protein n=1 Tax=Ilex paraguariensis TaxID=185542 RepID=A0ABC8UKX9_9AQUA
MMRLQMPLDGLVPGSQIDQSRSTKRALKYKLKLREAKLDKIVRAINYAKLEKEAAELKLKLVELESTMAATDQIIKDLKTKCIMNYAKGCEDFRD